jgi:hypothetical protein
MLTLGSATANARWTTSSSAVAMVTQDTLTPLGISHNIISCRISLIMSHVSTVKSNEEDVMVFNNTSKGALHAIFVPHGA